MDSCAIEILDGVDINEGDEIIYFGEERPISDLSKELNQINLIVYFRLKIGRT